MSRSFGCMLREAESRRRKEIAKRGEDFDSPSFDCREDEGEIHGGELLEEWDIERYCREE